MTNTFIVLTNSIWIYIFSSERSEQEKWIFRQEFFAEQKRLAYLSGANTIKCYFTPISPFTNSLKQPILLKHDLLNHNLVTHIITHCIILMIYQSAILKCNIFSKRKLSLKTYSTNDLTSQSNHTQQYVKYAILRPFFPANISDMTYYLHQNNILKRNNYT